MGTRRSRNLTHKNMKKLKAILAIIASAAATLAGLDVNNYVSVLPPEVAKWLIIIPSAAAFVVHICEEAKTRFFPPLLALAAIGICLMPSCAAINSAITGEPIATTPVQREAGKPFQVATSDILRAESQPDVAWGLYDAGRAAQRAREVIDSGK